MKFFKTLILLSLLASILTSEVQAVPKKRPFEDAAKNDQSSLTVEEQTNLNRAIADQKESDEDEARDEGEDSSKKTRGETMPKISEASSQAVPEKQGEDANSSSSNLKREERIIFSEQQFRTLPPEQQVTIRASLKVLNDLPAIAVLHEEDFPFVKQQENAHRQIIQTLFSTDPRVQKIQKQVVGMNSMIACIGTIIRDAKANQNEMAAIQKDRITSAENGECIVRSESYIPIFELYQIPTSFLDKQIALLQEVQLDYLAGKGKVCFQKQLLARQWGELATATEQSVNILSQQEKIVSPDKFLTQNERAIRDQLVAQERQFVVPPATFPVDRSMLSLPWDFNKTFGENVADLPQEEDN